MPKHLTVEDKIRSNQILQDVNNRFVTDEEKEKWNNGGSGNVHIGTEEPEKQDNVLWIDPSNDNSVNPQDPLLEQVSTKLGEMRATKYDYVFANKRTLVFQADGVDRKVVEMPLDAREVLLRKNDTHIQWQYEEDDTWVDLIPLTDITGPMPSITHLESKIDAVVKELNVTAQDIEDIIGMIGGL